VSLFFGQIATCAKLPESVWGQLPLSGLEPSSEFESLHKAMLDAISLMQTAWPARASYTTQWISIVQWVAQGPLGIGQLLTSSTFPAFPHCAFMSKKAMRHIPPNIVLESSATYALLENLFHEALHQQLSSSLLFLASIRDEYDSRKCSKIEVPWRGSAWEPDRVFHATFVYSQILNLRIDAIKFGIQLPNQHSMLIVAKEALLALEYLYSQLSTVRQIFSSEGLSLFEEVAAKAELAITYARDQLSTTEVP
jgi:hypothetical protein